MSETFAQFWKVEFQIGQPKLHPKDRQWMECYWPAPLQYPICERWDEYIAGDRFVNSNDKALHLSLIPTPYLGNLRDSKVLLFLANPGFADTEYYFEEQPGVREKLINNLYQEPNIDFPFVFLDPRLAWSSGFQWWQRRLRPLLDVFISRGIRPIQAMELLSHRIAAVELIPYHSRDGSELKGVVKEPRMPSVSEAREFLARSSHNREKLTVLLRSHQNWTHQGCATVSEHYHHGLKQQTISLDPKYETGEKILAWLER